MSFSNDVILKKKINILVWMSEEICASRAIAFWALKLHFFQFNVLLGFFFLEIRLS